jgi:hypothetical protein
MLPTLLITSMTSDECLKHPRAKTDQDSDEKTNRTNQRQNEMGSIAASGSAVLTKLSIAHRHPSICNPRYQSLAARLKNGLMFQVE